MVSGNIKNNIGIDNEFTAELAVNFLMSDRQICHEQALTYLLKRFTLKGMDEALEEIRMSERKKYLDNIHIIPGGKEGQKDKR
ncbi:MAG: hypothetical protein Q4D71_14230 [Oscillospiraceae bacterium]|nr:hypothetical protein [Oscillospiraceae bacterium]